LSNLSTKFFCTLKIFSGDHGQSSVSGMDYIPPFNRDTFRGNGATCIDGQASWDTVLQCTAELHADPSHVSFTSIPSGPLSNILDQEDNILGDFSMSRSGLTIGAGSSQPLQSNWQVFYVTAEYMYQYSVASSVAIIYISE